MVELIAGDICWPRTAKKCSRRHRRSTRGTTPTADVPSTLWRGVCGVRFDCILHHLRKPPAGRRRHKIRPSENRWDELTIRATFVTNYPGQSATRKTPARNSTRRSWSANAACWSGSTCENAGVINAARRFDLGISFSSQRLSVEGMMAIRWRACRRKLGTPARRKLSLAVKSQSTARRLLESRPTVLRAIARCGGAMQNSHRWRPRSIKGARRRACASSGRSHSHARSASCATGEIARRGKNCSRWEYTNTARAVIDVRYTAPRGFPIRKFGAAGGRRKRTTRARFIVDAHLFTPARMCGRSRGSQSAESSESPPAKLIPTIVTGPRCRRRCCSQRQPIRAMVLIEAHIDNGNPTGNCYLEVKHRKSRCRATACAKFTRRKLVNSQMMNAHGNQNPCPAPDEQSRAGYTSCRARSLARWGSPCPPSTGAPTSHCKPEA